MMMMHPCIEIVILLELSDSEFFSKSGSLELGWNSLPLFPSIQKTFIDALLGLFFFSFLLHFLSFRIEDSEILLSSFFLSFLSNSEEIEREREGEREKEREGEIERESEHIYIYDEMRMNGEEPEYIFQEVLNSLESSSF